jgi:hypothetical protein
VALALESPIAGGRGASERERERGADDEDEDAGEDELERAGAQRLRPFREAGLEAPPGAPFLTDATLPPARARTFGPTLA